MTEERTETLIHTGFAPLGGEVKYADVVPGTTIREAASQAGVSLKEKDILLNDEPVDVDTVLEEIMNPMITLIPAVEAGC